MEQHQFVNVTSSWNVQGPYDINCILQIHQQDERTELPLAATRGIELGPPPFPNDSEDESTPPCQLVLSCRPGHALTAVEIVSSARHVELYDSLDSYCSTVRGERLPGGGADDSQTGGVTYLANLTTNGPLSLCRLKFVSLSDKHQLTLVRLRVSTTRTEGESFRTSGSRGIDMTKVRRIMSELQQPIPENVQRLMQTVEQYQKNQASVLEDFQRAAASRLASSGDTKSSVASSMAGVLNAFSKAMALREPAATTRGASGHAAGPGVTPAGLRRPPQSGEPAAAQQPSADAVAKLMTAFGAGGRADAGAKTPGACDPLNEAPDMLGALRAMCRDVSHMRAADRQAAERSCGPDRRGDREECSATRENVRQADKSPHRNGMLELEQRLTGYIAEAEKRIMGRLDRQTDLLRDHIDLRFKKLEALLEHRGRSCQGNVNADGDLVTEELD